MFTGTLRSKQLQFRHFLGDILWATRLSRTPAWLVVLILLDTLVLTTLNAVGFSWVVRTMVNGATSGDRTAVLWALGVGLAVGVIGCLSWGIDYLSRKYQAEARALVETRAADAIIGLSPQRYLARQAGAWLSIVHNDAAQVATLSPFTLSSFAASTVQALASLAYLAYMNPLITVMTLVFSSLLLVISLRGYPEAGKAFRAANENAEQWSGALLQALRGRVTVYLYEAESWFMSRLSARAHESVRRQIEYNNRAQAIFFSGVAAVTTAHILTFAIGGLLLFLHKIPPGDIPAYWILVSQLLWPVQSLTDRYKGVQNGVIAVRRLRSIIPEINCPGYHADVEEAGDTGPREEKDAASAGPPDISLRQVTFAYGDRLVLHNVTFDIPAGQLIVIAGPNGSGKSTIIRLLAKLETGYQGGILVNGQPLEQIGTANWRSQLAWVPQEDMFFNDSVEYNLTFGQETQAVALEEALVASRLDEVILRLPEGLSYVVGEAGKALSAGQRQRLAIARALFRRPRLLLVDEPTSSIDRESKEALVRALVQRKGQSTIVLVTHDPDMVRIADWIVVLDGGKVVWQGPAGEHGTQKATATADWNA